MIDIALTKLLEQRAGIAQRIGPSSNNVNLTNALPRLVYTLVDDPATYNDDGRDGLRKARYQLDVFAKGMDEARGVLLQIAAPHDRPQSPGLDGYRGAIANTEIRRIYFDSFRQGNGEASPGQNQAVARATVDVLIDYRELLSQPNFTV